MLADRLKMTVGELEERMGAREFDLWKVLSRIEAEESAQTMKGR